MRVFLNGNAAAVAAWRDRLPLGILLGPTKGMSPAQAAATGLPWALDNGAYTNRGAFGPFWRRLKEVLELGASARGWGDLQWIVLPDAFDPVAGVGDARHTLWNLDEYLGRYWPFPEEYDLADESWWPPFAVVGQDGMEDCDWDDVFHHAMIACFFLGGSTRWKLSKAAADLGDEARRHGLQVHMGRVNGVARLKYARFIGCDSVDGTGLTKFSGEKLGRLERHFRDLAAYPELPLAPVDPCV